MGKRLFWGVLLGLVYGRVGAEGLWGPAPEAYQISPGGAIEISDGGQSTGDRYLLSAQEYQDFRFSFDLIPRPAGGSQLRAIVVWSVAPNNPQNRRAVFLPVQGLVPEQRYHFRLIVLGEQVRLYRDDELIATNATIYGEPPARGRVGFLHYYNHNFRYENVKLEALDVNALMRPRNVQAHILPQGAVQLQWECHPDVAGLLQYRIWRDGQLVGMTTDTAYTDISVASHKAYEYAVIALTKEGRESAPVRLKMKTGLLPPPLPPLRLTATQRLDGSVRLKWQLVPHSRCAGVQLYWSTRPEAVLLARQLIAELPPTQTEYLASAARERYCVLVVKSPDEDRALSVRKGVEILPMAPLVSAEGSMPAKHPYLLYSQERLERARRALQTKEYEKLAQSLRASAESLLKQSVKIPTEPEDGQNAVSGRLQQIGLYYQLLGDERCAQYVREALVAYAKLYNNLPVRGGRVRLAKTISGLYEATWFVPLICAYDLVYESPCFSAEDHKLIKEGLLRPAAELFWVRDYNNPQDLRPGDLHYKCYNFQAWFISAVGLCGLLLRDADMLEYALDGPYGLKHLLAHDVHDDGLFWERSAGYHSFVLSALFPFLQAAYHCNLDLYKLAVPDDYNEDREPIINYCVGDGDNGPKSLQLMFDALFYYTFPDLTWPVVADSSKGPLSVNPEYRTAWERYRDPKYAWLIHLGRQITIPRVGPQDAEAKIWMAWDDKYLYVAANITDQIVRNSWDQPGEIWQGDALWLGLKWRDEPGGPYDFIYGLSPGDFDKTPPIAAVFNRFSVPTGSVSTGQFAVRKTPLGYALEFAIPVEELQPQQAEKGTPFVPQEGRKLVADFVLYDCDAPTGATSKEKMLSWACVNDRYDSAQGGIVILSGAGGMANKTMRAPRAQNIKIDGLLEDWASLGAVPASIGPGSAVMTDASSGGPRLDDLLYELPAVPGRFDYTGESFGNNGVLEAGCSLFPSSGFALLREQEYVGELPSRKGLAVNMTFGPYGGGHGHPDKLSLVVWRDGQHILPDFGSCSYDSKEKGQWTAHTISHNTLTVDGKSQWPALEKDNTWPCDTFERRAWGKLDFFHADALIRTVQASCDHVYEGVQLTRTVALISGQILDIYRAQSAEKHIYDYALHIAAPFAEASVPLEPLSDPLGQRCGYQHIHKAQGSSFVTEPLNIVWSDKTQPFRIVAAGGEPTQLIIAESITTALDRRMPMMILRREAKTTAFITMLNASENIAANNFITAQQADGHEIVWPQHRLKLAADPNKPIPWEKGSFKGALVCRQQQQDGWALSLVRMHSYQDSRLTLKADRPLSLYIKMQRQKARLKAGYDSRGQLLWQWDRGKPQIIIVKPRQEYVLTVPNKP